ncbi:DUF2169 family type VI secretion system accessory protein [Teredinibacter waterburyi]|uniref:DUF2169 family type VI secretion system accessory protein n=1 Tax=Teredinibacter waterburyi TaxID=1500538 RepID=UPI00165FAAA7|nr:DUF2169 domain-containing protein [Teredinibacter waterburyi]
MLQLKNTTPFAADIALFPNEQGIDTLYVLAKASFRIGPQWTLLEEQAPLQEADQYRDEPVTSSLVAVSDYHPGKPCTDILMLGKACALEQRLVTTLDVSLRVGSLQKVVRVFGSRQWQHGFISNPEPFTTLPMIYENAFGGSVELTNGGIEQYDRNPVGKGFAGGLSRSQMDGVALPNLECPKALVRDIFDQPEPACFAPRAPNWQPRVAHVGTYDEAWEQTRAPFLPVDYSPRFMNAAHPELIYPSLLQGGEPFSISGMHPAGDISGVLPSIRLACRINHAGTKVSAPFKLETLIFEPNLLTLSMVWKAQYVCNSGAARINDVNVSLLR